MTKMVTLTVTGAASDAEARIAAKSIAENNLVKCSWYGADPYWGRLLGRRGLGRRRLRHRTRPSWRMAAPPSRKPGPPSRTTQSAVEKHMAAAADRDRSRARRRPRNRPDDRHRPRPRLHQREFEDLMTPTETARILIQALPYIQRFTGKSVVVKLGGAAIDAELDRALAQDVLLLRSVGVRCVLVHGGGPQVDAMMKRMGKAPEFKRRPARHRRGDAEDRPHGAGRRGQPQPRRHDQPRDAATIRSRSASRARMAAC